jgi:RNA polymerase sigma-70 factor (sigma-E family)
VVTGNLGLLLERLPEQEVGALRDVEGDFAAYVAAHWPRLVRSAVLLGCTPAEAEDVVQSALERCLRHWRRVRAADDRDAYVHRVLINTFTSARRRRWTGERPTADVPDTTVSDGTSVVDDAEAVLRGLARLTVDQRAAVVLRYYVHLGEQQMATVLGVAPGTVKSRLARALEALAEDPALAELRGAP